jgi:HPt (histidine-containing phosphotransfer) domain-containing protein
LETLLVSDPPPRSSPAQADTAATADQPPDLDPDTVRDMHALLTPEAYAPLLQAFFDDVPTLQGLSEALTAGQREEAKRRAHRMKGAAQVLGLRGLADVARALEEQAATLTPASGTAAAQLLQQAWWRGQALCRSQGLIP